ncbi:PAC2 family protein [Nanoarchaeota archaeon]
MSWSFHNLKKIKLNNPVLIEGLPGIGNVGKIAVDFLIDELKAEKLCDVFSNTMPNSVFVNEENLVELPLIEVYYKKTKNGRDFLFLSGDVQPISEESSYDFSEKLLELVQEQGGNEVVTLGGIGLPNAPKKPKIYCTGNSKKLIQSFKKGTKVQSKLYGIVGPIVGVSGLLVGLAEKKNIEGVALLAETYGHPMYLGMNGARVILDVLKNKFKLKMNLNKFEKNMGQIESEISNKTKELKKLSMRKKKNQEVSYIG